MINSQQQKIISLSKNMLFSRELLYVSYYSEVLSEFCKKSGGSEISEDWNGRSLIVPLSVDVGMGDPNFGGLVLTYKLFRAQTS